jgi:drug/metabolite transporter (DMT)-like permease
MPKSIKGILYASVTAVLWGVLAIALKYSLKGLTPADITWFRFFMAFVVLFIFYYFKKPQYLKILRNPPWLLIVATLCLALNYYGFVECVSLTSAGIAQVFIQLGPVLLAVAGFIFFREKATWRQIIGLFLVIAGLVVFYNEQLKTFDQGNIHLKTGIVWVIAAAFAWAVYSVLLKILVLRFPPVQLNLVIFGLPALLYIPFINLTDFTGLTIAGWLILIFLGLNTLFAYIFLSLAIHYIEANKVSVIIVLNPLLTFALMAMISYFNATWIEHEYYSVATMAGALIALCGAVLTILKKNKPGNITV